MVTLGSFRRRLLAASLLLVAVFSSLFLLWRRDLSRREREQILERRLALMGRDVLQTVDFHRRLLQGMSYVGFDARAFDGLSPSLCPFLVRTDVEGRIAESYRGPLGRGARLPLGLLSTHLSATSLLDEGGGPLVVLARPVGAEGWIVAGFSPAVLFPGQDRLRRGEWALLLSSDGRVLVSMGDAALFPFGATMPAEILLSPQSTRTWLGVLQHFLVLSLPGEDFFVAVGYPESLIWQEALDRGLAAGGAVALGALSVLILIFPLFSSVLTSLTSLSTSLVEAEGTLTRAPDPVEAMETLRALGQRELTLARFAEFRAIEVSFGRLLEAVAREGEELAGLYEEASAMEEELSDSNRRLTRAMERLGALLDLSRETQSAGDLDGAADGVARELGRLFGSPFTAIVALRSGEPFIWSWAGRPELKEELVDSLRVASPGGLFSRFSVASRQGLKFFQFPVRTLQRLVGGVIVVLPAEGDDEGLRETMEPFLSHLAGLLHSRAMFVEVKEAYHDVALRMQVFTQAYHEETGAHLGRIGDYALLFGGELGLPDDYLSDLRAFSQLHDVGKLRVPQAILSKSSALTEEEFEIVKGHTLWGAEILGDSPWFSMARDICLGHHERWCGGGYPRGLSGEAIPLAARIVSLCDVYDALRSRRSYKPPFSHERALRIILEGDGRVGPDHFDPKLLAILRRRGDDLAAIFERFPDEEKDG